MKEKKPQEATESKDQSAEKPDSEGKHVHSTESEVYASLEAEIAELEGRLKSAEAKAEEYLRRLQYLQADFENYRKRVEKEMGDAKRFGNERLLSDLLVVNDELELALQKSRESKETLVLVEGVGMVHKRLQSLMAKEGVERIKGVGSKFTPDKHEAALSVRSDKEEGTIVEEIRPGYLLKGKVLRPSIVNVAVKEASEEAHNHKENAE